jgi:hypothetical protein
MNEKIERAQLISDLAAAFPSTVITEQTVDVYVRDLWAVPLRILRPAIEDCRADARFFPTVAEIREKAGALVGISRENSQFADCKKCFGAGMETYVDVDGYTVARHCDHKTEPPPKLVAPTDPDDDLKDW